jgi:hypothetical protein
VPVGQAQYVVESCNDAGIHISIFQALLRAEGVEITVPPHALTNVRSTPEMDTRQFILKYLIFLSKKYGEECVPAGISTTFDQEVRINLC